MEKLNEKLESKKAMLKVVEDMLEHCEYKIKYMTVTDSESGEEREPIPTDETWSERPYYMKQAYETIAQLIESVL